MKDLFSQPLFSESIKQIQELLHDAQKEITGIRPPIEAKKKCYQELMNEFNQIRGIPLYYPYIGSARGHGPFVELLDGSIKYDFIGGIGVHFMGHSHPLMIEAALKAALSNTIMQGNLQQNNDSLELMRLLQKTSGMDHVYLTSSGAMANENALKMAFQKHFPATRILAFEHCFTGRTLTLSQITDKAAYREGLPPNLPVDYVPFFDPEDVNSAQKALKVLKKHLARYPKQHAVMIIELVQGESGFYPGNREFFISIMKVLREHNIAILIDEVQTFGRTPSLFAFHYFGLQEYVDLLTIGKVGQVCATFFQKEYCPKIGLISQTFTSSTSAIQASNALLQHLINGNYYGKEGKIEEYHHYFVEKLKQIPQIKGPYGIGAMIAFTPYEGDSQAVKDLALRLFDAGVIVFIAGREKTRIRMLLPIGAITKEDIDNVIDILKRTL